MADNYAEQKYQPDTTGQGKLIIKRSVEVSAGVFADAVVPVDAAGVALSGPFATITTTITRPTDTNAYAVDDVLADSTSAPTVGGNTLAAAARVSGGSAELRDITIISSATPAAPLQGELWIFDSAVTAVNDNATFALSDADALKLVAVIPFTLVAQPSNSVAIIAGINLGFTCVGSADLRYLVRVKNAYVPANAETLTVRAKIKQV